MLYWLATMHMVIMKQLAIAGWLFLQTKRANGIERTAKFCDQYYERNTVRQQIHEGLEEDSIVDLVRQQYLSFPYPYVSSQHIQIEENYYQSPQRNIPISTYPSLDLDMVNHYLFEGRNGFK